MDNFDGGYDVGLGRRWQDAFGNSSVSGMLLFLVLKSYVHRDHRRGQKFHNYPHPFNAPAGTIRRSSNNLRYQRWYSFS